MLSQALSCIFALKMLCAQILFTQRAGRVLALKHTGHCWCHELPRHIETLTLDFHLNED